MVSVGLRHVVGAATIMTSALAGGCAHKGTLPPAGSSAGQPFTQTTTTSSPAIAARNDVVVSDELLRACNVDLGNTQTAPKFDFDRSDLHASDRSVLDQVARCVTTGPLKGRALHLVGRADPRGEQEYNMVLGSSRAASVERYLESLGVAGPPDYPELPGEAGRDRYRRSDVAARPARGHQLIRLAVMRPPSVPKARRYFRAPSMSARTTRRSSSTLNGLQKRMAPSCTASRRVASSPNAVIRIQGVFDRLPEASEDLEAGSNGHAEIGDDQVDGTIQALLRPRSGDAHRLQLQTRHSRRDEGPRRPAVVCRGRPRPPRPVRLVACRAGSSARAKGQRIMRNRSSPKARACGRVFFARNRGRGPPLPCFRVRLRGP